MSGIDPARRDAHKLGSTNHCCLVMMVVFKIPKLCRGPVKTKLYITS